MTSISVRNEGVFSWEFFLLGGCSLAAWFGFMIFADKSASLVTVSQFAYFAAFAMNHPHFLSSYGLLYSDFKSNLLKKPRYIWAGIIVPGLLLSYLVYAFATQRVDLIGHALNAMFFLVGWHYVKQVFGCIVVTSARRKIFYSQLERRILLGNLFSLWALSFVNGQVGSSYTFYGIVYSGLGLPASLRVVGYVMVFASALLVAGMHLRKYIETGVKPSAPGMAALLSLYVWYLPVLSHPAFGYMIPFFHSMQYLALVWSFKSNQANDAVKALKDREQRAQWTKKFIGFGVTALVLGALSFEFIPDFLDAFKILNPTLLGASPFMAAFLMFINIHHYFIDNVIWRSDNEQVKKFLFAPATAPTEPASAFAKPAKAA